MKKFTTIALVLTLALATACGKTTNTEVSVTGTSLEATDPEATISFTAASTEDVKEDRSDARWEDVLGEDYTDSNGELCNTGGVMNYGKEINSFYVNYYANEGLSDETAKKLALFDGVTMLAENFDNKGIFEWNYYDGCYKMLMSEVYWILVDGIESADDYEKYYANHADQTVYSYIVNLYDSYCDDLGCTVGEAACSENGKFFVGTENTKSTYSYDYSIPCECVEDYIGVLLDSQVYRHMLNIYNEKCTEGHVGDNVEIPEAILEEGQGELPFDVYLAKTWNRDYFYNNKIDCYDFMEEYGITRSGGNSETIREFFNDINEYLDKWPEAKEE